MQILISWEAKRGWPHAVIGLQKKISLGCAIVIINECAVELQRDRDVRSRTSGIIPSWRRGSDES